MASLYPRINNKTALSVLEGLEDLSLEQLRSKSRATHPEEYYASTGGTRINKDYLVKIGNDVRDIAKECGYPNKAGNKQTSEFDVAVAIFLYEHLEIVEGEVLRPETWSFISLLVVPDVVKWRFPSFHFSRCLGGRRNCFERLWLRAKSFDLGSGEKNRWLVLEKLTEDAFVSIMERPSLSGNTKISKVIGLTWLAKSLEAGGSNMEEINRKAIRKVRARMTLYYLDALDSKSLRRIIASCYDLHSKKVEARS